MSELVAIDLHVHTALSPCADERMLPPAMLLAAERQGIAVLGIVDHNSAGNAGSMLGAAEAFKVRCFVVLEIESSEGVHVLSLFDRTEAAMGMDELVSRHLPDQANRPDIFGDQHLVDEWGDTYAHDLRLLLTGTDLRLADIVAETEARGGLAVPAHVDRMANGLLATLGFVPPDLRTDLFEVSRNTPPSEARRLWPDLDQRALLSGSDAHRLWEIGLAPTWISRDLAGAHLPIREWGREVARELVAAEGGRA